MATAEGVRRRKELAREGQRHVEDTIAAAFQILASIDHELFNTALWPSQQRHPPGPGPADPDASSDPGAGPGGSLGEARHRYTTAVAALRGSVAAVSSSAQEIISTDDKVDEVELQRLEERASVLRKEIESQNKDIELLMNQLRNLISDVSMWQSPSSV
uniref:Mediator of RNA polymerase II transcription subunit 30 n=1 Tax=Arundo donax TaxID=35708 RepID=A0A0A8YE56_ARUDO